MTRLSVNINKIATIRNARGGNNPDLVKVAQDCERFGAQGITVHPRPDERHIRYQDVVDLKEVVTTEFNIEGNPDERFIELVRRVRPEQVTLVPDAPDDVGGAPPLSAWAFALDTVSILRDNIGYRWFAASVMTYGFGNLMVVPLYALYQVDVLHISNTQVANLANFASLASIVGMFFWGRFIDRKGAGLSVLISIGLIALIPVVYLLTRSVEGLFFAAALSGFGFAGIELSYMQSILTYAEPGRAAQYQSLHSLLLGIRGVLAPLAGIPLMKAFGYPSVFTLALVIMLAGCFMQWMATRRESSLSAPA